LVLAHHLTPLSDVLDTARYAEKQAKKLKGKHSLAIISSKRGGADRSAKAKASALLARMLVLIGHVQRKEISASTAYELLQLHQQLQMAELPVEAFEREALRIIVRKRERGGGKEVSKAIQEQFRAWFKDRDLTLEELAQEMIIAREFAKAYDMAKKEVHA
jgi:CRISPR/Cas system-associated protein Cas10 (large subunit of type III CRISPR-Cas system)